MNRISIQYKSYLIIQKNKKYQIKGFTSTFYSIKTAKSIIDQMICAQKVNKIKI
jgi:hypothetical protein